MWGCLQEGWYRTCWGSDCSAGVRVGFGLHPRVKAQVDRAWGLEPDVGGDGGASCEALLEEHGEPQLRGQSMQPVTLCDSLTPHWLNLPPPSGVAQDSVHSWSSLPSILCGVGDL